MELNEVEEEYFNIVKQGKVPFTTCGQCGKSFQMPRSNCPFCGSAQVKISSTDKRGRIIAWTIIERGLKGQVTVVIVEFNGFFVKGNYIGKVDAITTGVEVIPTRGGEEDNNVVFIIPR